ncbi:MAG: DNA repair protein RecO [Calditrichales bacterium]|nr:MAG: DNA repair protein RecO [Calditrichales bacterium]
MSHLNTQAFVIKSLDWKDTSRIVTLFTREKGKISVIAKGARRAKSQFQGILESINLIEASIYISENRQIQVLGQVSLEESYQKIKKDYTKTAYIFAILELTDIFFQKGAADPVFFDFLTVIIQQMENVSDPRIVFWYFLLKIASYLGFRPEFDLCKNCSQQKSGENVIFSVRDGAVICNACGIRNYEGWTLSSESRSFLELLQKTNHKKLDALTFNLVENFSYTDFLISYLKHHSEEDLKMTALKMLK